MAGRADATARLAGRANGAAGQLSGAGGRPAGRSGRLAGRTERPGCVSGKSGSQMPPQRRQRSPTPSRCLWVPVARGPRYIWTHPK
eukprot:gene13009-biopygen1957